MKLCIYNDVVRTAAIVGCSIRHVRRLADELEIEPANFKDPPDVKYKFSKADVLKMKQHFESGPVKTRKGMKWKELK